MEKARGIEKLTPTPAYDIRLQPWETLLINSTPHPKHFWNLKLAYALSTFLWVCLFIVSALNISLGETLFWWVLTIVSIMFTASIYVLCESVNLHHRIMAAISYIWIFFLIVALSIIAVLLIQSEVARTYPREWWEDFLGLPFTLSSIIFAIVVLIVSSIVWKVALLVPDNYSFPLYVASTSLILVSVYVLLFPINTLGAPEIRGFLFLLFGIVIIVYGLLLVSYILRRGGFTFIMTTKRIVLVDTFLGKKVQEHFYDKVQEVNVIESLFGKRHNYGDLDIVVSINVRTPRGETTIRRKFTVHGVQDPFLVKNTILALSVIQPSLRRAEEAAARHAATSKPPAKKEEARGARTVVTSAASAPARASGAASVSQPQTARSQPIAAPASSLATASGQPASAATRPAAAPTQSTASRTTQQPSKQRAPETTVSVQSSQKPEPRTSQQPAPATTATTSSESTGQPQNKPRWTEMKREEEKEW